MTTHEKAATIFVLLCALCALAMWAAERNR